MTAPASKNARRVNRLQNLAIVLLALSAVFLFANFALGIGYAPVLRIIETGLSLL